MLRGLLPLSIVKCGLASESLPQGAVLLDAAMQPRTVWEFEAVMVLLSGHWPPRGLLSGVFPPNAADHRAAAASLLWSALQLCRSLPFHVGQTSCCCRISACCCQGGSIRRLTFISCMLHRPVAAASGGWGRLGDQRQRQ